MDKTLYKDYDIVALRVIDGDTVKMEVDVGLDATRKLYCRLLDIQAPDAHRDGTMAEEEATDYLYSLVQNAPLRCRTYKSKSGWAKKGKYGRYLVELFDKDGLNLNTQMLRERHAIPYD